MGVFSRRRASGDDSSGEHRESTVNNQGENRRWLTRRNALWASIAVVAAVVLFGCWLGFQAKAAKSDLEQARNSSEQSKNALLQGKGADAQHFAAEANSHAQAAQAATHSLPWSVAAAVPWLGSPFKTGQQIADVATGLVSDVLKPTADVGIAVAPDQLLADGRLNVTALRDDAPALSRIAASADRLHTEAQAIKSPLYISALADARTQIQTQTADTMQLLTYTSLAARLSPSMMGADGPRTYFMGFQTNAEARGTGGLLGAFGILRFDNGKPTVDTLGQNTQLDKTFTPMSFGPDYEIQYGYTNPTTDFRNSNQSAHFPYTAQIWKSMWKQQSGMDVDGVIALDPIALSYILGATGPVTMPDGEIVTQNNVVELTESTAYIRYPTDQSARKQYLQGIAIEVVKKLTGPVESPRKLLDALGRAVSERRISVWSSSPAEQNLLEQTPLANVIPDDPAPYAHFVINNLGGNKMDYYLKRQIEYTAGGCDGARRDSTVTLRLTNTLADPSGLPEYVAGKMGFPAGLSENIPRGSMILSVRLLTTKGAQVESVHINGQPTQVVGSTERGHPSFESIFAITPGQSTELTFQLSEPTAPGKARVPVQPLVDNVTPKVSVPTCTE